MPLCTSDLLQPFSSSDQDSAQSQSRQHVCGGCNVLNAGQSPSGTCESGFSALEGVYHGHPFFLQNVPEIRKLLTLLLQAEDHPSLLDFHLLAGDTHPIVEVRHDERHASFERILKCLSEPFRKTVERFSVARSTTHVLRLWWPVHHYRSDIFLPVSEPDSCSLLQPRKHVEHPHHALWLPKFLVHEN